MIALSARDRLLCVLAQQGLWLLLVWAAAQGLDAWASLAALAALALFLRRLGAARWRVLAVLALGVLCGVAVDGSLSKLGLVMYAGAELAPALPPLWILLLWALLAALVAALPQLGNPWLSALLGAVGGPLAYAAAAALGAVALAPAALWAVGTFYALALPVLVLGANRALERRR